MSKKTETFSARFDPETDFALELLASQTGKKKTKVVVDSIHEAARELAEKKLKQDFAAIWHENEGVRKLNLFALPGYKRNPEEDALRVFVLAHKGFFYADEGATVPNLGMVLTLWDKVEHYHHLWRDKRHENYWVAAEAMESVLKKAKIKPPRYGQEK